MMNDGIDLLREPAINDRPKDSNGPSRFSRQGDRNRHRFATQSVKDCQKSRLCFLLLFRKLLDPRKLPSRLQQIPQRADALRDCLRREVLNSFKGEVDLQLAISTQ